MRFDEKNNVIENESYRAIIVGLQTREDISYYMDELEGLAEAADIEVAGRMIQAKDRRETATYIGSGKVVELAEMCENMEVDMVVFNDELSGIQLRNLEEQLNVKVIDRTMLILDIFASRAVSREGQLQVELAQLQYRKPRLLGFGKKLSRLGGGIGTRGPGEKKLETDKRHIARRMDDIKSELEDIKGTRQVQRASRQRSGIPLVAVVGYTNSGKSALMNRLLSMVEKEEKAVTEKDMLFATLDTFQRRIKLDSKHEFILIDTVGFVSRLPHALVKAFKATLEEVVYADLLLHVVDSSYSDHDFHIEVTESVLKELGAGDKERIMVYNKIDLLNDEEKEAVRSLSGQGAVGISAKYGENIEELLDIVKSKLFGRRVKAALLIPFNKGDVSSYLCGKYQVENLDYRADGTYLEAELEQEDFQRYEEYAV